MRIIKEPPPIYELAKARFPLLGSKVHAIFCWGDIIYNPFGLEVSPPLVAHEAVHSRQQKPIGPQAWWERYLAEPAFRLAQEIPAHEAEVQVVFTEAKKKRREGWAIDLGWPVRAVAAKLAAPLYDYKDLMPRHKAEAIMRRAVADLK